MHKIKKYYAPYEPIPELYDTLDLSYVSANYTKPQQVRGYAQVQRPTFAVGYDVNSKLEKLDYSNVTDPLSQQSFKMMSPTERFGPNFGKDNRSKWYERLGNAYDRYKSGESLISKWDSGALGGVGELLNDNSSLIAGVTDIASNAIHENSRYADDPIAGKQQSFRNGMSNMLIQSGNPYLMAAGVASKASNAIFDATGMRADNISKDVAKKAGVSGAARLYNNLQNYSLMPGVMQLGGKKIEDAEMSKEADMLRGAFSGTLGDMDAAQQMGGTRTNWLLSFGKNSARGKMNSFVQQQNENNKILTELYNTNTLRKNSNSTQELSSQDFNAKTGRNFQSVGIGKEGMKVQEFKDGGVVGIDSSVIPEGALHAHKNNLEEINPELDEVTEKGIPIIVTDAEGNYEQICEIEKEEIILRTSLTKQIEELWRDGSEEAMIKAGKLLAEEIMTNTDDNTGKFLDGYNSD